MAKRRVRIAIAFSTSALALASVLTGPAASQDIFQDLFGPAPSKKKPVEADDTAPARQGGAGVPERVERDTLPELEPAAEPEQRDAPSPQAAPRGGQDWDNSRAAGGETQFDPLEARRNGYRNTTAPAPSQYDNQDEFARGNEAGARRSQPAAAQPEHFDWSDPPRPERNSPPQGQAMKAPPPVQDRNPAFVPRGGQQLTSDPWANLKIAEVEEQLSRIELPTRSAAVHDLWLRLITAPAGRNSDPRLAAVRADALNRTGLTREASDALSQAGDLSADPVMATLAARTAIGAGNSQQGCETARSLTSQVAAKMPAHLKGEVILIAGFCAAASDNKPAAAIAADLAAENGLANHAGPDALKAIASGQKPTLGPGKKVSLLDYRILQLGGAVDVTPALPTASPALLATLARDSKADPASRLAAAEAAAGLNAISVAELAEAYRAMPGGAEVELNDAAAGHGTPTRRASLFKAAENERTPLRKSRLIRAFLDDALRAGISWPALQLMAQPANALQPTPEIGWFAETAVEASLAAGDYQAMQRWTEFAAGQDGGARADLRHWMALADIADPNPNQSRTQNLGAVEELAQRGRLDPILLHRLATVLDALDTNVPMPLWEAASRTEQPSTGHLPDTGVLSQLQDAAKQRDFARTVLLTMRTLGPNGPEGAHMIALGDSIRALKRAGLEPEARRLGLEALFASWPRATPGH